MPDKFSDNIILIGPSKAGKSTLGEIISSKVKINHYSLDELFQKKYFKELGIDKRKLIDISQKYGFPGIYQYLKPFEISGVEKFFLEFDSFVVSFGAGHSIYEEKEFSERLKNILLPYKNVFLILPSSNVEESLKIIEERNGMVVYDGFDFNKYFVEHPLNKQIAKYTIFTEGNTPEETSDEIIEISNTK